MALIEDMFKGNAMTGVAVGAAALLLGPTILPSIGRALRPVAKTMIKGGIVLYRETARRDRRADDRPRRRGEERARTGSAGAGRRRRRGGQCLRRPSRRLARETLSDGRRRNRLPARRRPGRFGTIVTALIAGMAGGLLAPLVLPRLERNIRPATRASSRPGSRSTSAGARKRPKSASSAGDLMAEARAEYEAEQEQSADAAAETAAENEVVRLRRGNGREAGSPNA